MPLADWETRWQISLSLASSSLYLRLVLLPFSFSPPLLSTICVQAAAVQLHPLWHMLNGDSYAAPPNEAECNLGVLPQDVFSIKYFISCKSGGFLCTRFCYFCISIISAL